MQFAEYFGLYPHLNGFAASGTGMMVVKISVEFWIRKLSTKIKGTYLKNDDDIFITL